MPCQRCGDFTMPFPQTKLEEIQGTHRYYAYCPACIRNIQSKNDEWIRNARNYAFIWGYNRDSDVAKYHYEIKNDGTIRWWAEPVGDYSQEPIKSLINDGFKKGMSNYNFKNPPKQYIENKAYLAGKDPKSHSGFWLNYECCGFLFQSYFNPSVNFKFDEGELKPYRSDVFSNNIMTHFDNGLNEYFYENKELLSKNIKNNQNTVNKASLKYYTKMSLIFLYGAFLTLLAIPAIQDTNLIFKSFISGLYLSLSYKIIKQNIYFENAYQSKNIKLRWTLGILSLLVPGSYTMRYIHNVIF